MPTSKSELFDVLTIPNYDSATKKTTFRKYRLNKIRPLGKGSYGKVFEGELIDEITEHSLGKFAVKVFRDQNDFNKQELEIFNRYYTTRNQNGLRLEEKISHHKQFYILTEYIPGEELISDKFVTHSLLSKLNFQQRIKLITQLILQMDSFHHYTPTTGNPIIHGDIKGSNIKINITINDEGVITVQAFALDFGFSMEITDSDYNKLIKHKLGITGNPLYFAPETLDGQFSIASDTYMSVSPIATILGASFPLRLKQQALVRGRIQQARTVAYSLAGLAEFPDLAAIKKNRLKNLVISFLNSMQSPQIKDRPSPNEVTKFFVTLNQLINIDNLTYNYEDETILVAKLIVLATGAWHRKIGTKEIAVLNRDNTVKMQVVDKTYADFDFQAYPLVCEAILCKTLNPTHASFPGSSQQKLLFSLMYLDKIKNANLSREEVTQTPSKLTTAAYCSSSQTNNYLKNLLLIKDRLAPLLIKLNNFKQKNLNLTKLLEDCNLLVKWLYEIQDMYNQKSAPIKVIDKELEDLNNKLEQTLKYAIQNEKSKSTFFFFGSSFSNMLLKSVIKAQSGATPIKAEPTLCKRAV